MNISLGACTPTPTIRDNADGSQTVVYGGCPTEIVDVLDDGTNVYHDETTGKVFVSPHGGGLSTTTLALIVGGIAAVIFLSKR